MGLRGQGRAHRHSCNVGEQGETQARRAESVQGRSSQAKVASQGEIKRVLTEQS